MRIKFDPASGAFYIRLRDGDPFEALELGPGAYVHIDEHGTILQLEFLSLEEFAEFTAGGLEVPDRIEDPANWEPSELTRA
jgi:uncharacterized protein YuzE